MDRGLLPRAARRGDADGARLDQRAGGRAHRDRISRDRRDPRPADPAARTGAGADRRSPGPDPRTGERRRRVRRGDPRPGQDRRDRGGRGRDRHPLSPARPRFRPADAVPRPARRRRHAGRGGGRARVSPDVARRRHRIGQDRGLFRGGRRGDPRGPPDAGPAARDRADRAVPAAVPRPLRVRAGRVAFGAALDPAPPRLARDRERRGAGHGRRAIGAVPPLSQPRPDRRRRGA